LRQQLRRRVNHRDLLPATGPTRHPWADKIQLVTSSLSGTPL